ncbi:MAG: hypothetical protein J2P19_07715, partial [Pseudonocardia sp.]|nr:hypothetical protein [Pseudonocardia sp.]
MTADWALGAGADLPDFAARFASVCQDAGLPVGPDRAARFARALVTVAPTGSAPTRPITTRRLRHCAAATLVS